MFEVSDSDFELEFELEYGPPQAMPDDFKKWIPTKFVACDCENPSSILRRHTVDKRDPKKEMHRGQVWCISCGLIQYAYESSQKKSLAS